MASRTDLLDLIETEAHARAAEPAHEVSLVPARAKRSKHSILRVGLTAIALAGTTSTADMLARPEPAAASCSDWLSPSYTTSDHSKACGLSIRFYYYSHSTNVTDYPYHTTCRVFNVTQFTCYRYYDAGTARACRTIRVS